MPHKKALAILGDPWASQAPCLTLSSGPTKPPKKRKDFPMNGPVTGMYLNRTALQYGRHRRSLFIGGEKDAGMD